MLFSLDNEHYVDYISKIKNNYFDIQTAIKENENNPDFYYYVCDVTRSFYCKITMDYHKYFNKKMLEPIVDGSIEENVKRIHYYNEFLFYYSNLLNEENYVSPYEIQEFIDGKRRRTSKTFPVGTTLSVVKQFLAERELEYARGSNLSTDYNLTFTQFADMYFETYTQFLSPSTLINYKRAYNNSKNHGLKNYFGDVKLRKITSRHIQEYVNFLSSQVSPKSLKNYIMLLNVLFKTAVQLNIIPKGTNPTMDVVKPKLRKNQIEAFDLEEFNLLLQLAETDSNPDIKLILNLALLSGIRRGEMAALKWDDVNFKEKYIYIHECRIVLDKQEYTKPPKTDSGIRKIYVPDRLINILKE